MSFDLGDLRTHRKPMRCVIGNWPEVMHWNCEVFSLLNYYLFGKSSAAINRICNAVLIPARR